MTEVARPIQLANLIKFGSRSFRSIEHERVHNFWQTWKNNILHNQTNVTQTVIDVDTFNNYWIIISYLESFYRHN